jgi:hypothetical protein
VVSSTIGIYSNIELPLLIVGILLGNCYFFHDIYSVVILAIFSYFCNSVSDDGAG